MEGHSTQDSRHVLANEPRRRNSGWLVVSVMNFATRNRAAHLCRQMFPSRPRGPDPKEQPTRPYSHASVGNEKCVQPSARTF